jgi:hypothetical protein
VRTRLSCTTGLMPDADWRLCYVHNNGRLVLLSGCLCLHESILLLGSLLALALALALALFSVLPVLPVCCSLSRVRVTLSRLVHSNLPPNRCSLEL